MYRNVSHHETSQRAAKPDLTDPIHVAELKASWVSLPVSMVIIEYWGTGDPFFGGTADDRSVGVDGLIKHPGSTVATATFSSIEDAHAAALSISNRRHGSRLGVVPTWHSSN